MSSDIRYLSCVLRTFNDAVKMKVDSKEVLVWTQSESGITFFFHIMGGSWGKTSCGKNINHEIEMGKNLDSVS